MTTFNDVPRAGGVGGHFFGVGDAWANAENPSSESAWRKELGATHGATKFPPRKYSGRFLILPL